MQRDALIVDRNKAAKMLDMPPLSLTPNGRRS